MYHSPHYCPTTKTKQFLSGPEKGTGVNWICIMQRGGFFTTDNMDNVRVAAVVRPPTRPEGFGGLVPQQISLFSRSGGGSRGRGGGGEDGSPLVPLGSILDGFKQSFQTAEEVGVGGCCMGPFPPGRPHHAAGHLGNKSLRK